MRNAPFDVTDFPMLHVCEQAGCSTILFGHGRCLAHDRQDRNGRGRAARVDGAIDAAETGGRVIHRSVRVGASS
jgi:hypothetical protein